MKYETPELKALRFAIDAIQGTGPNKNEIPIGDSPVTLPESVAAYADWE